MNSYVYYESTWSREDGLVKKKYYHRSITIGDAVYHVGGYNDKARRVEYYGAEYKEKWSGSDPDFEKGTQNLINRQIKYPEVLEVPADYCANDTPV